MREVDFRRIKYIGICTGRKGAAHELIGAQPLFKECYVNEILLKIPLKIVVIVDKIKKI